MKLTLQGIVPMALQERSHAKSDVWAHDLTFESSKAYQLLAPSGRGKSTLIHILYGLQRDFSGTMLFEGHDCSQFNERQWAEFRQSQLSIVFQDLRLFPHLTGLENIRVKSELKPFTAESDVMSMCQRLGIDDLIDKPCGQMSFGEQQRVAIVRALMQPFDWLLLDEPFSHLDPDNVQKVSDVIRENCQQRNAGCVVAVLDADRHFDFHRTFRL